MKIVDKRDNAPTSFKYLLVGDVFLWDDIPYIKMNTCEDELNAVDLRTGRCDSMKFSEIIIPVKATLVLE